jgi:hypothetical protein
MSMEEKIRVHILDGSPIVGLVWSASGTVILSSYNKQIHYCFILSFDFLSQHFLCSGQSGKFLGRLLVLNEGMSSKFRHRYLRIHFRFD